MDSPHKSVDPSKYGCITDQPVSDHAVGASRTQHVSHVGTQVHK